MTKLYLIGSLRNPAIPAIGNQLRKLGFEVFDDWHAAGPKADDEWQRYETERGHNFQEALSGYAARHVFEFDRHHLRMAEVGVLILPAGKSGHLELGFLIGRGVPGFIVYPQEPERFDVMYNFAAGVFTSVEELLANVEHLV